MTVYIIDAYQMNLEKNSPQAEIVWLHRDLLRGCTTNRHVMQVYYNFITNLLGDYVLFEVYEYKVDTSYDMDEENTPVDVIPSIALSLYNKDKPHGWTLNSMSFLISYTIESVGDMENEMFVISDSLNEVFLDSQNESTAPELGILDDVALLFTTLSEYIIPLRDSDAFKTFQNLLFSSIPDMVFDFYNPDGRLCMSPVNLILNWVTNLEFLDFSREECDEIYAEGGW